MRFGSVPAVAAVLYGVKPAVVAIVLAAAWRIGSRTLHHRLLWVIAAAAFVALFAFDAALPARHRSARRSIGFVGGRVAPARLRARRARAARRAARTGPR